MRPGPLASESERAAACFEAALKVKPGSVYSPAVLENNIARLESLILKQGRTFVTVEPSIKRDEKARRLDVDFIVRPGQKVFVERIDIDEALVLNGRHHDGGVAASDVDLATGQFDRRSKGHLGIGDGCGIAGIDQAQQVGKAAAGTVYCLVKSHEALRYENVLDPRESGQVSLFDVPRQISKRKPK